VAVPVQEAESEGRLGLVGLPGAAAADAALTRTAPHAGVFAVVAIGTTAAGCGSREVSPVCR